MHVRSSLNVFDMRRVRGAPLSINGKISGVLSRRPHYDRGQRIRYRSPSVLRCTPFPVAWCVPGFQYKTEHVARYRTPAKIFSLEWPRKGDSAKCLTLTSRILHCILMLATACIVDRWNYALRDLIAMYALDLYRCVVK